MDSSPLSQNIFHCLYPSFEFSSSGSGVNHLMDSIITSTPHEKYSYFTLNDIYLYVLSKVSDGVIYTDEIKKEVRDQIIKQKFLENLGTNGIISREEFLNLTPEARDRIFHQFHDRSHIAHDPFNGALADSSIENGIWILGKKIVKVEKIINDEGKKLQVDIADIGPSKFTWWIGEFSRLINIHNNVLTMIAPDFDNRNHKQTKIGQVSNFEIPGTFSHIYPIEKWVIFKSTIIGKRIYFSIWRRISTEEYLFKVSHGYQDPIPIESVGLLKIPTSIQFKNLKFNLKASSFLFDKYLLYHSTEEFLLIDIDEMINLAINQINIYEFDPEFYTRLGGHLYIIPRTSSDSFIYNDSNLAICGLILQIDRLRPQELLLQLSNSNSETIIKISISKENEVSFKQLVVVDYPYLLINETYSIDVFYIHNSSSPRLEFIYRLDSSQTNTDGSLRILRERKKVETTRISTLESGIRLRKRQPKNYCEIPLNMQLCHDAETPTILVRNSDFTFVYDMTGKNLLTVRHKETDESYVTTLFPLLQGFAIERQVLSREENRRHIEMIEDQRRDWNEIDDS